MTTATNTKRRQQMPDVKSTYGAPMGRAHFHDEYDGSKARCFRLRLVDGAYDDGGAYWGGPANIYACTGFNLQLFVRAKSRDEAKGKFLLMVPTIKFLR